MKEKVTNFDVVKKLIGNVHPIGETYTDEERFENLRRMTELAEQIIMELEKELENENHYADSIQKSGKYIKHWFESIAETYFEQHNRGN